MQQLLHRSLVSFGRTRLDLLAACSEPCTSHQMRHQSDVFLVCHLWSPPSVGPSPSNHCNRSARISRAPGFKPSAPQLHPGDDADGPSLSPKSPETFSAGWRFFKYTIRPSTLLERAVAEMRPSRCDALI